MTIEEERVLEQLVHREVKHCVSSLVSELFKMMPERHSDYETLWELGLGPPDYEANLRSALENMSEFELTDLCEGFDINGHTPENQSQDNLIKLVMADESKHEDLARYLSVDPDYREPLEFWAVSDWFGEKLQEFGEMVVELFDFRIWGRTCSGQAIAMDYVIRQIANSMEVMPGQQYDWSK
jgi:hypothetical protein